MPLDQKTITEVELGLVDPIFFGTRLGYSKRVTLVFTDGKKEALWNRCGADDFGCTAPRLIKVDEAARNCTATCVFDVFAIGKDSITPTWNLPRGGRTPANLTPDAFRYKMVLTIVHELVHVSQGWQTGKRFWLDRWQESVSAFNRA